MGFWKYAQEDPGYIAIVDPDGTEHAAGDVLARANQVVHALRELGMQKGDTVAAVLPNGAHPFHLYLAALQAGFYYVPINYRLSPSEIAYIVQDSDAKVFVSHERFADIVAPAADEAGVPADARLAHGTIPGFRPFGDVGRRASRRRCPTTARTGASMHYTSGTTGKPKGVKRALAEIDPDTSAELFTFLLGLFGIMPRPRQRAPVDVAELPHRGHDVRGQLAAHGAHRRVHGQVGRRRDAAAHRAVQAARTRTWCRRSSSACCSCPTT